MIRKHLLEDLQPYSCTYLDCKLHDQLYSSRTAWLSHEESFHRRAWICRDHPDSMFATRETYHAHLTNLHQSLTPEDMEAIIDLSVVAQEDTRGQCPFCLVSVAQLRRSQNLDKHIANHLERIACFAFPRNVDQNEDMDDKDSLGLRFDESDDCNDSQNLSNTESASISDQVEPSTLYDAAEAGSVSSIHKLLEAGVDVNLQCSGNHGNPLQVACAEGHKEIVQLLLDFNADVNIQGGHNGTCALYTAADFGHEDIVQLLLGAGADVNMQCGLYGNALQAATFRGHREIVKNLLDAGADVNAQGGKFGNPLVAASHEGHEAIARMLLYHGADPSAKSDQYGSALTVSYTHLTLPTKRIV